MAQVRILTEKLQEVGGAARRTRRIMRWTTNVNLSIDHSAYVYDVCIYIYIYIFIYTVHYLSLFISMPSFMPYYSLFILQCTYSYRKATFKRIVETYRFPIILLRRRWQQQNIALQNSTQLGLQSLTGEQALLEVQEKIKLCL